MYYGENSIMNFEFDKISNSLTVFSESIYNTNILFETDLFLTEADENKNWFKKIIDFIVEKISGIISAIKKVFTSIIEKIKKKKENEEDEPEVEIIGVAEDDKAADEAVQNIKNAASEMKSSDSENNSETTSAINKSEVEVNKSSDSETTSATNKSEVEVDEKIEKVTKKIENEVKSNLSNVNQDALEEFLKDTKYNAQYSSKKGSQYKPKIERKQKVFAILKHPDAKFEFKRYGNQTDIMYKLSEGVLNYRYNRMISIMFISNLQEYNKYNDGDTDKVDFNEVQKDFYKECFSADNFESLKSKWENVNAESQFMTMQEFDKEYKNDSNIILPGNYNIKTAAQYIKNIIDRLERYKSDLSKYSNSNKIDWATNTKQSQNQAKYLISINTKLITEALKCINLLSSSCLKCVLLSEQQNDKIKAWYKSNLKYVNITI